MAKPDEVFADGAERKAQISAELIFVGIMVEFKYVAPEQVHDAVRTSNG